MKKPNPNSFYLLFLTCILLETLKTVNAQTQIFQSIENEISKNRSIGTIYTRTLNMKIVDIQGVESQLKDNAQSLVIHKGKPFININGTGHIYTPDSSNNFKRIDSTVYQGSTFGAKFFDYNDTLILAGGYGFWNATGAIRYYNETHNEWSIYKINNPVAFSTGTNAYSFWNRKTSQLFLIFTTSNAEFNKENKTDNRIRIQCLNLKTKSWWPEDKYLNCNIATYLSDLSLITELEQGLVFNAKNSKQSILIDFTKESIYSIAETATDNFFQTINKSRDNLVYCVKDTVKIHDIKKNITYKVAFDKSQLHLTNDRLYDNSGLLTGYFTGKNSAILILSIIIVILLLKDRSRIKNKTTLTKTEAFDLSLNNQLVGFQNFFIALSEQEKTILELLASNSIIKKNTTTLDINKKLGIEKKPFKIQNNLRASAIGEINKKFSPIATANEMLIERIRSDFDKRYFEYKINNRFESTLVKNFSKK